MGRHTRDRVCVLGSHICRVAWPAFFCVISHRVCRRVWIEPASQVTMHCTAVQACVISFSPSLSFCGWALPLQYVPRRGHFLHLILILKSSLLPVAFEDPFLWLLCFFARTFLLLVSHWLQSSWLCGVSCVWSLQVFLSFVVLSI
jgi:hypothetical protein